MRCKTPEEQDGVIKSSRIVHNCTRPWETVCHETIWKQKGNSQFTPKKSGRNKRTLTYKPSARKLPSESRRQ